MLILLYGALLISQLGTSAKQYAMKHCGVKTPGAFNSVCINLARSVVCLVVSAVIWLLTDGTATTLSGHIMMIVAGIGTALTLLTWILSSRLISLTLLESIGMIGSLIIPLILAPFLYEGDSASPMQWIGCVLIFISLFLFTNKDTGAKQQSGLLWKILILSIYLAGTAVSMVLKKYYTYHITANHLGSIEYFTFIGFVAATFFFIVLFFVFHAKEKKNLTEGQKAVELPYKKVWKYILLAAVALYVFELFASYAAQLPSAIYYPLSRGLCVICTFLLDVFAFKDKITTKKIIGLFVVLVAIVLINL